MSRTSVPPPSDRTRPLIDLEAVDVAVAGNTVLHGVDFKLHAGERWGVIGANGSGKTTFLHLLAGAAWPAPGRGTRRYDFGNGPERDSVGARQRIALVGHELQDRFTRFGWNFSALDVVLSGVYRTDVPRRNPLPAERLRAVALLRRLGGNALAERPFLSLSRGEQRRVLIARALAFAPAVLLLDEPASGLDVVARGTLDGLLATLDAEGERLALVCTAHSAADLPRVATRYLEIAAGRIVAVRDAEHAASPAVAQDSMPPPRASATSRHVSRDAPLIEVRRADVWLASRRVLHGIDWQLGSGERWLVMGANGSGKSTFLRLLHGQLRPARGGHVRWPALGNPRNVWELRRRVAWLSPELQAGYRFPTTVRECVGSGFESSIGLTRPLDAGEAARVEELLAMFGLGALAERRITALSYGQLRRALIARSLANRPRVLLLDEPWEGLDGESAALLDAELDRVAAKGTELVCSSHLTVHRRHFTHRLVIANGAIAAVEAL